MAANLGSIPCIGVQGCHSASIAWPLPLPPPLGGISEGADWWTAPPVRALQHWNQKPGTVLMHCAQLLCVSNASAHLGCCHGSACASSSLGSCGRRGRSRRRCCRRVLDKSTWIVLGPNCLTSLPLHPGMRLGRLLQGRQGRRQRVRGLVEGVDRIAFALRDAQSQQ